VVREVSGTVLATQARQGKHTSIVQDFEPDRVMKCTVQMKIPSRTDQLAQYVTFSILKHI
jgi:hypothetical protein